MEIFNDLPQTYPLMRGGAVLFIIVGLGIVIGGIGGRGWMLPSLITGAVLAVTTMAVLSATKLIFVGLGYPPIYHWIIMAVGFGVEIVLVNYVVFKIKDHSSPEFWLWMLIVVGAHFLIFTFSHGPLAGLLGLVCIINAAIGLGLEDINYRVFWVIDGFLKIGFGTWMLFLTYNL